MENTAHRAIAIVGVGAILPDAPNAQAFWNNVKTGRYSISEVRPDRWDPALYYDPDPSAPDKAYSKIGGWVRESPWDPIKWKLPLPPRVVEAMDEGQKWAVACTREALTDFGYPERPFDLDRTAVILGNAMGGEMHYMTALRVYFPEYTRELEETESFASLPESLRRDITRQLHARMAKTLPTITEDSMPGELSNCIAGRVANLFNFHGPNYTTDAACASAMAAISSATEGLIQHDFDMVVTGGIDHNMGASSFVKFCKIGALSATGTRPYGDGADGFVMGEGAAVFLMKRLADAEREGDKIYAVLRGVGGSSDGRGKGITAPNPVGQKFAIERGWENAGLAPSSATYIEGHGTSTKVGDVVEAESIMKVLNGSLPPHSVALGSVKSNIGHLKAAAGAAGLLKATMALHEKVLPPSLNATKPNPGIDFQNSALFINTELRPWNVKSDTVRRAGVSAFGFGGTNFHMVLEEYIPHRITGGNGKHSVAVGAVPGNGTPAAKQSPAPRTAPAATASLKAPLRGALVVGAASVAALIEKLRAIETEAKAGRAPAPAAPREADLRAPERVAIDYGDADELAARAGKAAKALETDQAAAWKALRAQGVFRGRGAAPKVAFLYTGQGSQYVNMMKDLREAEPIVATTFAEADAVMKPLLGKPLSEYIFIDSSDKDAVAKLEDDLRQTAITQPAVLATDLAMTRLMAAYGIEPDMTMGHSLGEYGALVASGGLPFNEALEAVSARGREMTRVSMDDNGKMAAVFAPLKEIERVVANTDGYVVIANINSEGQAVIGGTIKAVEAASEALLDAGYNVVPLPVSHAFHTQIVAPASEPLRETLRRMHLTSPRIPIVANVDGEFYPTGSDAPAKMLDILGRQIAAPVQFVKGLRTLYEAGARVFVEMGPKKALQGFAEEVLGPRGDVLSLFTNHPKVPDVVAFNQALCGLYAAGLGRGQGAEQPQANPVQAVAAPSPVMPAIPAIPPIQALSGGSDRFSALGQFFAGVLEKGWELYGGERRTPAATSAVVTGASVGLPGTDRIFDDSNVARILKGEQLIDIFPTKFRRALVNKNMTRLVKSDDGNARFETITDPAEVLKLAGRGNAFDLQNEFGITADRLAALDRCTQLAIAAGLDALRDAGIPMVLRYKTTSKNTQLPDRWGLPDGMRDDTGVIFASVFPGYDSLIDDVTRHEQDMARRAQLAQLEELRTQAEGRLAMELDRRIADLRVEIEKNAYTFDRRWMFRILSMGHSQFAELIGARGPNTHVNAACASTTHAVSVAQDWIREGRCRRVIIVSADDITTDRMLEWFGAGFLVTGAAATDEDVAKAALPFDRRRHGMILGMGAAAFMVESEEAARERGIRPICEVLATTTANSAFHGTRLDVNHICQVMEKLVREAEARSGLTRYQIAERMLFVSHETYTPARGGSASAEVHALRSVFGAAADKIVVANTKGFTGHAMGAGIEDFVAIKALETGYVPPVANFKEVDPELGPLNLSKGGYYPVEFAMRLGAGFGSQIAMTLVRLSTPKEAVRPGPNSLGYAYRIVDQKAWDEWLSRMSNQPSPSLEVVHRTLRVRDTGAPAKVVAAAPAVAAAPTPAPVPAAPAPAKAEPVRPVEPVAKAAPPPPPPPAPAAPKPAADPVKERVLALVSEKTGYPADMLGVDLDLEADLGVDTVKQAELFAAIREAYGIQRDDSIKLREFPTLTHVIQFVYDRRPDLKAAPAAPAPVSAPAPAMAPATKSDPVKEQVLALVAEKTGYPADMLGLDLDLEADLGVDTVKQAELFAAIREAYGIQRDDSIKLREFPTLNHVIQFVYDRRPDLKAAPAAPAPVSAPVPAMAPATKSDPVKEQVLALVAEKTGYPADMLGLDLDLEADLGVDTVKQAELFAAIREAYGIQRDDSIKLREFPTLNHVIQFVYDRRPDLKTAAAAPAPPTVSLAAAPTAPAPAPAPSSDPVKERVLALVAEKTGYPADMLGLDLDLEADLGVDTVKQAELFAAIRETYGIQRDDSIKLRDFPTLNHVIQFVRDRRPDLAIAVAAAPVAAAPAAAAPAAPAPASAPAPMVSADPVQERILELVVEKTGYPKEMLDIELDLEADLGVDTVKQAELFAAIRETYGIQRDDSIKLREFPTLKHVIGFVYDRRPDLKTAAPLAAPVVETPAAAAAPAPAEAFDPVKERVLELVVEKTGYPKEMLDVELDLEADLGVDTVKQAELFAAIRESYGIQRDDTIKLRDFPTLKHVIGFVYDRRPDLKTAAPLAVPVAETPAAAAAPDMTDPIAAKVLEIVAAKTGYPPEMLDIELDLESDLGVDTVKQAEVFASVREAFGIPRVTDLKLRDFPTLKHVIQFARDHATTEAASTSELAALAEATNAPAAERPEPANFEAASRIPRRIPVPVLRPALDVCKPTGVVLAAGTRVLVAPDQSGVAEALTGQLQSLGVEVVRLDENTDLSGPFAGVFWLPALDNEGDLAAMDIAGWREALRIRVKALYATMRTLYEQIATPGTFLVTATALGGQHGYGETPATAPLGGAVTGFAKTFKRERSEALVKAVDFESGRHPEDIAGLLIEETLRDPGAVEIGYGNGLRWTVGLQETPVEDGQPGLELNNDTVFVITGAAGSIVSAITADLAGASGGTFYLLDLAPEPAAGDPDIARFGTDKDGLKRDLFARIQARGERATPAMVEKELATLERMHAARVAIDAVTSAGGTAHYFSVNLTDTEAVTTIIDMIREQHGRVDVLLHAAGLERSHFLPDKDEREFNLVFDVKADGWFNLLHAIGEIPLGATVAFSSIAGRFGNGGQADYSAANDLMCKIASSFRATRPSTRAIALDWTAWGGIGMATRGSIPKMMEMAGIGMLPPEAGVPWIRRELTAGGTRGEVVVAGRLGILMQEWDATGGLDVAALESATAAVRGPVSGQVAGMGLYSGLKVETTLDPKVQPFLFDHQIEGTPVLPGVMGVEAFAEAALLLAPGWHLAAVEKVDYFAPFKFYRGEPRTITVETVLHPAGEDLVAECQLTGSRALAVGSEPQVTKHFSARVRLSRQAPEQATLDAGAAMAGPAGPVMNQDEVYRVYFHGPAYQVVAQAWREGEKLVAAMTRPLPPNHEPAELPLAAAPRLMELCFQAAGLWDMGENGRLGLPLGIDQVTIWPAAAAGQAGERELFAIVTPRSAEGPFDIDVIDKDGTRYLRLDAYRMVTFAEGVEAPLLKAAASGVA